jgi:hypothetical protein
MPAPNLVGGGVGGSADRHVGARGGRHYASSAVPIVVNDAVWRHVGAAPGFVTPWVWPVVAPAVDSFGADG